MSSLVRSALLLGCSALALPALAAPVKDDAAVEDAPAVEVGEIAEPQSATEIVNEAPLIWLFAAGGAVSTTVSRVAMMTGDSAEATRDVIDLRFNVGGKTHTVQSSRQTAMQLAQALRELSRGA